MKRMKNLKSKVILSLLALILSLNVVNAQIKKATQRPVWDASTAAIIFIDYQPEMIAGVKSGDPKAIVLNARFLARLAKATKMPIVLSTVAVKTGVGLQRNKPTDDSLHADLSHAPEIDRTTMDAYEDQAFLAAVKATGKKRLIIVGLFTEICLTYPVIEFLADGYEVMFVSDAVGGTSLIAHETAIQRMIQAGAIPNSCGGLAAELFRDWKNPVAKNVGPVLGWYMSETQKLAKKQ